MPRTTALLLALVAAGCGSSAPTVASGPAAATVVDGDVAEWSGALTRLADGRVTVGVRNDGERLIVAVVTSDRDALRHAFLTGLTVWVDPAGGTDRVYGVQYPLGVVGGGGLDLAALRGARDGADPDPEARLEARLGRLAIVEGDARRVYALDDAPDVEAAASVQAGQLVVEVAVPLAAVGAGPGDAVGVGVETPELDREALREQVRAQRGGRGAGGGRMGGVGRRGGPRGGERPEPPAPVEAWVRADLDG